MLLLLLWLGLLLLWLWLELLLWMLWLMLHGLRRWVVREVLELWGRGRRRVEIGMGSMIIHRLIGHICETILRRLWSSRSWMLHGDEICTGTPHSPARRWSRRHLRLRRSMLSWEHAVLGRWGCRRYRLSKMSKRCLMLHVRWHHLWMLLWRNRLLPRR